MSWWLLVLFIVSILEVIGWLEGDAILVDVRDAIQLLENEGCGRRRCDSV
jgi:hypothetical protein